MPGSLCTTKSLFVENLRSCVVEPALLVKVLSFLSVIVIRHSLFALLLLSSQEFFQEILTCLFEVVLLGRAFE